MYVKASPVRRRRRRPRWRPQPAATARPSASPHTIYTCSRPTDRPSDGRTDAAEWAQIQVHKAQPEIVNKVQRSQFDSCGMSDIYIFMQHFKSFLITLSGRVSSSAFVSHPSLRSLALALSFHPSISFELDEAAKATYVSCSLSLSLSLSLAPLSSSIRLPETAAVAASVGRLRTDGRTYDENEAKIRKEKRRRERPADDHSQGCAFKSINICAKLQVNEQRFAMQLVCP